MNNKYGNFASVKKSYGFIESNNYKTYYEVHTPNKHFADSAPVILLAGGPGLSYTTLTPLLRLAETRPVIVYDQIDSGKSTRSEQFTSLNISDYIEQFNSVMNEVGVNKYHILGHSWGTILGVNIALQYPEKIQSLILHSGIADWTKCLEARKRFEIEQFTDDLLRIFKKLREGIKVSSDEKEIATKRFNSLYYCRVDYPAYLLEALNDKDTGTNQLIWNGEKNPDMTNYNISPRLEEIECPTLIISGMYDGISVGQADLFRAGIKNSQHIELQNSSHYAHIEDEIEFLEQVKNFIVEISA
ncbi:alpha/beta fold hydrolase [Virgibacillus sp. DJP39]|uniref:alpha/beta fold hydrolase n=1 Tax=Virgibacillus sp. DJP39 TaxID=3409790 RepID=UPI003BB49C9A